MVNGQRMPRVTAWFEPAVDRARRALQLETAAQSMKGQTDWSELARQVLLAALEEPVAPVAPEASRRVFIPDESGMGGDCVTLGEATFDPEVHRWMVWQSEFRARPATAEEIIAVKRRQDCHD